ncbi:L,D-transpeptidase [Thiorhodococcus mannitoliphagus]|uniref:L,D-transpeptidase n=1 Tax=Thiorhodococcus mannitoliphagus TaxID=329406 RepID=A0A6P1DPK9_9GAMM|nr:L,D-transpeptidase [Thiorhodococcus mannitoliphagus]NEX19849.1 L,D-transpeptidase [Thiorhodococcus mannitoliphagus]
MAYWIQRLTLPILISLLFTACAHAPTEFAEDRPAPEPKIEQTTSGVAGSSQNDEGSAETSGAAPTEDAAAPQEASEDAEKPRKLIISLSEQAFTYKENDQIVRTGPISSGAKGYPTPTGRFAILSKDKDKVSSRYTNQLGMQAWMPYAMQFHGHYFLHEGWLPGYPDSHGCVRVGEKDARFLFATMKIGDAVTVEP